MGIDNMPRSWRRNAWALAAAVAVACSGGNNPAPSNGDAADQSGPVMNVTGTVAVVGNTPVEKVVIRPEPSASQAVEVRGTYRDELRAVAGARVRAVGSESQPDVMTVTSYRILYISGHRPVVGILEVRGDQVSVRSQDTGMVSFLYGVPAALRREAGAKVWVILDEGRGVQAYGVIKRP